MTRHQREVALTRAELGCDFDGITSSVWGAFIFLPHWQILLLVFTARSPRGPLPLLLQSGHSQARSVSMLAVVGRDYINSQLRQLAGDIHSPKDRDKDILECVEIRINL